MIYRYKATLPRHKNFIRIYEVKSNATLSTLHLFLQNDLSFSPDQLLFFRAYNENGDLMRECGLFDTGFGSMDQIRLETLQKQGESLLHYVFDIFKGRYLELRFDGSEEEVWRRSYPRTIFERGGNPDQFGEDPLLFDEAEDLISKEEYDS